MIEDFLHYLLHEKRYSQHTVTAYRIDLSQFSDYLKSNYSSDSLLEADYMMIRSWMVALTEHNNSSRSINRKKTTLTTFYKYLMKMGLITKSPMIKVLSPKNSKRLPVFVEEESIMFLLDKQMNNDNNDFIQLRDRLIIELFYASGIRLSELVNLKEQDISLQEQTLKVLGKRNKERIIPFNKRLSDLFTLYIDVKKHTFPEGCSDYLFVTSKGKKTYQKLVYRLVIYYLSMVTTKDKKSPHVLRHTFATHMLNHGADLNAIKEILGHANLSATQVYTHNTIEKLKKIYKQAHPKA